MQNYEIILNMDNCDVKKVVVSGNELAWPIRDNNLKLEEGDVVYIFTDCRNEEETGDYGILCKAKVVECRHYSNKSEVPGYSIGAWKEDALQDSLDQNYNWVVFDIIDKLEFDENGKSVDHRITQRFTKNNDVVEKSLKDFGTYLSRLKVQNVVMYDIGLKSASIADYDGDDYDVDDYDADDYDADDYDEDDYDADDYDADDYDEDDYDADDHDAEDHSSDDNNSDQ